MNNDINKVNLFLPIEKWSEILMTIDKKIELVCTRYGYGKVNISFVIHKGNIMEINYIDEVSVRGIRSNNVPTTTVNTPIVQVIATPKPTTQDTIDNSK